MSINYDNLTKTQERYLDWCKRYSRSPRGFENEPELLNALRLEIKILEEFDPNYIEDWNPNFYNEWKFGWHYLGNPDYVSSNKEVV